MDCCDHQRITDCRCGLIGPRSIRNASGGVYANALPEPQSTQVRMGPHAYDGSFSSISFVPFPNAPLADRANITVESAHLTEHALGGSQIGDCVIVATSNSSSAELSLVVSAQAFWGAAATITASSAAAATVNGEISSSNSSITMTSGDLGTVTVSATGGTLLLEQSAGRAAPPSIIAQFNGAEEPLVVSLSFTGKQYTVAEAKVAIEHQRAATQAMLVAGSKAAVRLLLYPSSVSTSFLNPSLRCS